MTSFTPVLDLKSSFLILSLPVTPSIDRSILLWVTASFSLWRLVSDHVSAPYVIDGSMTVFMIFLLKHMGILWSLRNVLYCPNLFQADVTLSSISFAISFPGVSSLPKYLYSSTSSRCSPSIIIPFLLLFLAISLHMILVFFLFIFMPSFLPSLFRSLSSLLRSSSFSANKMISSANLRLFILSPLMLIPTSTSILLNISSNAAVNITGDKVSHLAQGGYREYDSAKLQNHEGSQKTVLYKILPTGPILKQAKKRNWSLINKILNKAKIPVIPPLLKKRTSLYLILSQKHKFSMTICTPMYYNRYWKPSTRSDLIQSTFIVRLIIDQPPRDVKRTDQRYYNVQIII